MADETNHIELLKLIQAQLSEQAKDIRALRETVIRLETHGYHEQINSLREEAKGLRDKIIVLETQGQFFSAGVAAGVSIVVTVIGGLLVWAFKGGS
ncbi:MAG: hypothetical protein ACXW13_00160 [Burkholderiaceae bacterium]